MTSSTRHASEGQALATALRAAHGDAGAERVAALRGIEVRWESWRVAEDRVVYLGECEFDPPRIRVNVRAVEWAAARLGEPRERIAEAALAHELAHLLGERGASRAAEAFAHAFVAEWMQDPTLARRCEAAIQNGMPNDEC